MGSQLLELLRIGNGPRRISCKVPKIGEPADGGVEGALRELRIMKGGLCKRQGFRAHFDRLRSGMVDIPDVGVFLLRREQVFVMRTLLHTRIQNGRIFPVV